MNKKLYKIVGEQGASIIRKYGLSKASKYNNLELEKGLSFYPNQGDEFRFSDHWGGQSASDELRKCESPENMILARRINGIYEIVKIVKKQGLNGKNIEDKVQESSRKINPKILLETYRELNRTGKLSGLSEDLRESFKAIFPALQKSDYSKVGPFLERYGSKISQLTSVA